MIDVIVCLSPRWPSPTAMVEQLVNSFLDGPLPGLSLSTTYTYTMCAQFSVSLSTGERRHQYETPYLRPHRLMSETERQEVAQQLRQYLGK